MTSLAIMKQVAFHPTVIKMRAQQDAMRRQFVQDYGHDFMGIEIKDETDAKHEQEHGKEGINRWTPRERKQYNALVTRLAYIRGLLRAEYSKTA